MLSAASHPLLLGHRGVRSMPLSGARPADLPAENTIAAFDYALANGCDGFEFDVRCTRDGRSVICHDPEFNGREISTTDYADLGRDGSRPPCLEDALARFGRVAYLDIELKLTGNEELVIGRFAPILPRAGLCCHPSFPTCC